MQLRKNGDELHGKIVHAVKAHVLEGVQDSTFSGTGKSGEDDELPGIVSRLRLHRRRRSVLFPAFVTAGDSDIFAGRRDRAAGDLDSRVLPFSGGLVVWQR